MNSYIGKRLIAAALACMLLCSTAGAAAQYQPVDPTNPYLPPVSGLFHGQEIAAETLGGRPVFGLYPFCVPALFWRCAAAAAGRDHG